MDDPAWRAGAEAPDLAAGRHDKRAGPLRATRHGLEGVAPVGAEQWQADDVTRARSRGRARCAPACFDLVLVGGEHPDPQALAAAGATWAMPEIEPEWSIDDARALAWNGPPTEG